MEVPQDIREKIIRTNESIKKNKEMYNRLIDKSGFEFLKPDNEYYNFYKSLNDDKKVDNNNDDDDDDNNDNEVKGYNFLRMETNKIANIDLDIIKITAQIVSVNGDEYKEKLLEYVNNSMNSINPLQFEFLKDTDESNMHKLFEYYVKIYKMLILNNNENELQRKNNHQKILDNCYKRAENEVKIEKEKKDKINKQLKLDIEYASINWDEFTIVETIEFSELEKVSELNLPLNKNELEMRSLLDKRASLLIEDEKVEEEERDHDHDHGQIKPMRKGIKVKSNNESRIFKKNEENSNDKKLIKCPLTNQLIPEDKFGKHIKILLQDTKYKEYQEKYEEKFKFNKIDEINSNDILDNIKSLIN